MHTFFINTTQNDMHRYDKLLEMQMETSRLVWLDCPIHKWDSAAEGYRQCVYKVNSIIDNYSSIGNLYNLIVYVNLCDFVEYADIPANKHTERDAMRRSLYPLLVRYIKSTIVKALDDSARSPKEILVMFEEDEEPAPVLDISKPIHKTQFMNTLKSLLAIPSVETIKNTVEKYSGEVTKECLDELVESENHFISGILGCYRDSFEVYVKKIASGDTSERTTEIFVEDVYKSKNDDNDIYEKSFNFNQVAMFSNNTELAQRDLVILLYLLRCVENGGVCGRNERGEENDYPLENTIIDWGKLANELTIVSNRYESKRAKIKDIGLVYMDGERRLAPKLYKFDNERFGIGKNGEVLTEITTEEVETAANNGSGMNIKKRVVVEKDVEIPPPFEGFTKFENADKYNPRKLNGRSSVAEFNAEVKKMKRHYIDYNERLSSSVTDALSNYAGDSIEHGDAWLKRRSVTLDEANADEHLRYANRDNPEEETKKAAVLDKFTQNAYNTSVERYLRFSASRSVILNDIDEQCNWFATSIAQIEESLKKIGKIIIGSAITLVFVLLPFLMTQWFGIMESALTFAIGLISLCIPLALLLIVAVVMITLQRWRCYKKWTELLEKVNKAFDADEAAKDYEKLLSTVIPSLRASYDYRMNVLFYIDCCNMVDAKLAHHRAKLDEYIELIKSILDDLQVSATLSENERAEQNDWLVDYNVPFCVEQTNTKFYSILDDSFIDRIKKEDKEGN